MYGGSYGTVSRSGGVWGCRPCTDRSLVFVGGSRIRLCASGDAWANSVLRCTRPRRVCSVQSSIPGGSVELSALTEGGWIQLPKRWEAGAALHVALVCAAGGAPGGTGAESMGSTQLRGLPAVRGPAK